MLLSRRLPVVVEDVWSRDSGENLLCCRYSYVLCGQFCLSSVKISVWKHETMQTVSPGSCREQKFSFLPNPTVFLSPFMCPPPPPQELVTCCFGVTIGMGTELCHLFFCFYGIFNMIVIIIIISIHRGRLVLHIQQTQLPRRAGSHRMLDLFVLPFWLNAS